MTYVMNAHEATDEAVLLLTRKLRRLHPAEFADVWSRLPDGARDAVGWAEARAELLRDAQGVTALEYPTDD
jgi:hypothetical protein